MMVVSDGIDIKDEPLLPSSDDDDHDEVSYRTRV